MSNTIHIYTDGACSGNPGPGGWGAVLFMPRIDGGRSEKELSGGEPVTTNNRMEMQAVIEALQSLEQRCSVIVFTDSQYVQRGVTEWLSNWKARGWKTASKAPVKNVDLWQTLDALVSRHDIEWRWVKGHAGDIGNERADALARLGISNLRSRSLNH